MLYYVERAGFQVLGHGGDFIKLPAFDFGEEAAELPDLLRKKFKGEQWGNTPGWLYLNRVRK